MAKLAPSILSADFSKLGSEVEKIQAGGANLIHVDVMDGHFVPNISFGDTVMKSLLGKTNLPFDVHLMIENPDKYIDLFITENTEYVTVHAEACVHLHRTLQLIKSYNVKCGVAINPATSLSVLDYVLSEADLILIMSVNPGFGGQKFIESALEKVKELHEYKEVYGHNFEIEIDGGITLNNVREVKEAGVNIIVAGSSIFKAEDVTGCTKEFVNILK